MRKHSLLLMLLALSLILFSAWGFNNIALKSTRSISLAIDDSVTDRDILPAILAINDSKENKPKTNFKRGHVKQRTLKNYFHRTESGYYIQLPNQTMVPTPAVVDGKLFLSGGFGSKQFYSFEAVSGDLNWAIDLDDDGPSSPAIADGLIAFNTESCTIFVCDLVSGKEIWSYYLGDPLMSMPTIANGILFTSYPAAYKFDSRLYDSDSALKQLKSIPTHVLAAFDARTGNILWQKWIDSDIMSAPVAKDDLVYITTFSGALYKVRQKSGEIIEAKAMRATSVPIFSKDNDMIVSKRSDTMADSAVTESIVLRGASSAKTVYKKRAHYLDRKVQNSSDMKKSSAQMDAGNGFAAGAPASANSLAAEFNIGYSNVSSLQAFQGSRSISMNGHLYNTMGDEIICTDANGDVKWKHKLEGDMNKAGGFMGTPPIYVNGYLIVATYSGEVLIIDEKGNLVNKYEIKNPVRYQPVVDKGWIYVTTTNGRLYAINTGNPLLTGWNMWGANASRTNSVY
jgi:Ca-activated chloride channel family protein